MHEITYMYYHQAMLLMDIIPNLKKCSQSQAKTKVLYHSNQTSNSDIICNFYKVFFFKVGREREGEYEKDLSFGHIISSHHLQRELEGNISTLHSLTSSSCPFLKNMIQQNLSLLNGSNHLLICSNAEIQIVFRIICFFLYIIRIA